METKEEDTSKVVKRMREKVLVQEVYLLSKTRVLLEKATDLLGYSSILLGKEGVWCIRRLGFVRRSFGSCWG